MSDDDNKIKGPGYYPKRPGAPKVVAAPVVPAAPARISPWATVAQAAPIGDPGRRYWNVAPGFDDAVGSAEFYRQLERSLERLRARQREAVDSFYAWDLEYRPYIRQTVSRPIPRPRASVSTHHHPRHNPAHEAYDGLRFYALTQHRTPLAEPEYNRARGISETIVVEARDRLHAVRILERIVTFDQMRWRRNRVELLGTYTSSRRDLPDGTFVHRHRSYQAPLIEEIGAVARPEDEEPNR